VDLKKLKHSNFKSLIKSIKFKNLNFTVMKTLNTLFFIVLLFSLTDFIFAQQGWNQDPRLSVINPTDKAAELPRTANNFINPNRKTRVEKTPAGTFLVNPNFIVHPDINVEQSEVILVKNKQVPNIMLGSANADWYPGNVVGLNQSVYVTTNGGISWFGWDTLNGPPVPTWGSDPGPAIDKNGRFFMSWISNTNLHLYACYSSNNGQTWSLPYQISETCDKNFSYSDDVPSSPFYGRTYTVWSQWVYPEPYIASSYTTNGGVNWSPVNQVDYPPQSHYSQGVDIRCGPNGIVYLVWAAADIASPYQEDYYGFSKSTNGGDNWVSNEYVFDGNGIRGYLPTKGNIRVNSYPRMDVDMTGGTRNGWIYIVGCDVNLPPSGTDPDIIFHRSTDGGNTWSQGIRVNQDALNNGAIQYFPAITVDHNGGIDIVYYDDRNVGGNLVQVYMSRSTDGGDTWVDFQVSDHSFAPSHIIGSGTGYQGDYIGICYMNNKFWPFWMDNYSGLYQAWTTSVDIITGTEPIANNIPDNYSLSQNYPNPFNPTTVIKYTLPEQKLVKLAVYDMLGKEVSSLDNEVKEAGSYEVTWDASRYPSGVYFYRITAGDYTVTKKMILLK
jgi:hypothetical protein